MHHFIRNPIVYLLVILPFLFVNCQDEKSTPPSSEQSQSQDVLEIILVRHAEKGDGDDPELTRAGRKRARQLAKRLKGKPMRMVYTTDTRRTRATAQPTADSHGLLPTVYDAGSPENLAARLKGEHTSGTILVVGHSNTVPDVVNALTGNSTYEEIDHDDYGTLYTVSVRPNGQARAVKNRY